MTPGIRGEAPFIGSPTPILCPGCGDRLFSVKPGLLKCEICNAEVRVGTRPKEADTLELQDGWGGADLAPAAPARVPRALGRQKRKTGMLAL
jgi:uncharacterized Zn finger protein (UPF0148 family)